MAESVYMEGMKVVRSKFRERLAEKANREQRKISVRQAVQEAGVSWRIGYGMADDTIRDFPRDALEKLCRYLECDLSELLVLEDDETAPA